MKTYQPHELALTLSPMEPDVFAALVEDIRLGGVLEPALLYQGKILDGWHRYKAAQEAGRELPVVEWEGDDPVAFVWAKNGLRRHWDAFARAANYARLVEFGKGWRERGRIKSTGNVDLKQDGETTAQAAKAAGVGETTMAVAKAALAHAPEAVVAVEKGQIGSEQLKQITAKAAKAKTPQQRRQIVSAGISQARALKSGKVRPRPPKAKTSFDKLQSVRRVLDAIESREGLMAEWLEALGEGKYAPEAADFVGRRLEKHSAKVEAVARKFLSFVPKG